MNSVDLEQALQEVEGTQVNDPAQVETGEAWLATSRMQAIFQTLFLIM